MFSCFIRSHCIWFSLLRAGARKGESTIIFLVSCGAMSALVRIGSMGDMLGGFVRAHSQRLTWLWLCLRIAGCPSICNFRITSDLGRLKLGGAISLCLLGRRRIIIRVESQACAFPLGAVCLGAVHAQIVQWRSSDDGRHRHEIHSQAVARCRGARPSEWKVKLAMEPRTTRCACSCCRGDSMNVV